MQSPTYKTIRSPYFMPLVARRQFVCLLKTSDNKSGDLLHLKPKIWLVFLGFFFAGNRDETSAIDKTPRKRLRSDDEAEITNSADVEIVPDDVEMLMLKAEALVNLHRPLEAVQSLNRYRMQ